MADCLLFYRSRSDLSKFEKSINMWTFISLLDGSLKSQMVSFAIPVAAVLPWSDSFLQDV